MLENSLRTTGVTKTTEQDNQGSTLKQISQAQFGATNIINVNTVIEQGEEGNRTKVVTETIGTPQENYARYVEIDTPDSGQTPDFGDALDTWGVQKQEEGGSSVFSEATYGAVLFGNLPVSQSNELIQIMKDNAVYIPNYEDVKSESIDGKKVKTYSVTVNTKAYVELLKKYDEILGLGVVDEINPDDYEQAPPISLNLSVDPVSRTLRKVEFTADGRQELLSGYGISKDVELPDSPIPRKELESQLQNILQ